MIKFLKNKSNYFDLLAYIWIGSLATLSFAPFSYSFLSFFSVLGLFWLEKRYRGNYRSLIKRGVWVSIFFNSFSFFWINYMIVTFGNLPAPIAVVLFLLYSVLANFKFPIFLVVYSFLNQKGFKNFVFTAGVSILFAEFFSYQIFPWFWGNLVGGNTYLAQNVEYTGVYGLSFLCFVVGQGLFSLFQSKLLFHPTSSKWKPKFIVKYSLPFLILGSFYLSGFLLFQKWSGVQPAKYQNILMVQPNAPLEFRDGRSFAEEMNLLMKRIERLVSEAAAKTKPDLIILPESSVPFFSAHNTKSNTLFNPTYWERYESLIYILANKYKANVLFNEIDTFFENGVELPNKIRYINQATLYDSNGKRKEAYSKSYLLVFGEYIPLGETFEFLYSIVPQIGRFAPGEKQNLITYFSNSGELPKFSKPHLNWDSTANINFRSVQEYYKENIIENKEEGKFLPLICYEVILPEFVNKFTKSGNADFIVNITNDKWYGKYLETYQHLELARLRSIEFRRWMVRSTNSGTSAFVDHLGQIVNNKLTPILAEDVYLERVGVIQSEPTFYQKFGNVFSYLIFFSFLIFYFWKVRIYKGDLC